MDHKGNSDGNGHGVGGNGVRDNGVDGNGVDGNGVDGDVLADSPTLSAYADASAAADRAAKLANATMSITAATTRMERVHARVILQPAIDAMSANIAVLEPDGVILTVNERWRRFGDANGLRTPNYAIGRSYFEGWREDGEQNGDENGDGEGRADDGEASATPRELRAGIEGVLAGEQEEYRALYRCHSPDAKHWYHLRVTPFLHNGVRRAVVSHANVTPLIEASEALRESEARFRNIADSVPIFIYMLRPDGAVDFINKPLQEYHGLSAAQLAGDGMYAPLHPDDIAATATAYTKAFESPRPVSVEFRMRGRDGVYRWFINQSIPRYGADASYQGYIGCCIDVHERKLAERAVEASERRYRNIFETATVAMWESDFSLAKAAMDEIRAAGVSDMRAYLAAHPEFVVRCATLVKVRNVNDAAVRLAQADSREHLLEKFADLFTPQTFGEFADELADLMEERGEYQRESFIRTLRGEVRRCMFTISLPPIASVDSVLAAVIDVTDQRTLEDALRRSEALNRAVLGSLKDLIAVLDGEGRIISVNHAWSDYASVLRARNPRAMVPGVGDNYVDSLSRAAAVGSAGCQAVVDGIQSVLSGAVELFEGEYRCPVAAEELWFLMTVAPLRGGGPSAVIALTDITVRKEAQNLMLALNARLLRAQEDERRRLAREMHDDVTQRLAVLAIEAGRLELQLGASYAGRDGTSPAEKVRHMTEQLVKLSTDVHAISRQLHPSILDDLGLADALESECHAFTDREGIAVTLDIAALPETMPNDLALCLYRILQEALRNVAKHAQTDRVRVTLSADAGREVILRIADAGVGFDARAARTGAGLGLASMRERARLVGAELHVGSSPGHGTMIEVCAPLCGAAGIAAARPVGKEPSS